MIQELYAVRYGKGFKYGGVDFPFVYYIAYVDGKLVLIDTGFSSAKLAVDMGVNLIQIEYEVKEILKESLNCTILITHSHWDHIDDVCKYLRAHIFMSEKTYQKAVLENCDDVREYLLHAKDNERITFIDSGTKILDTFVYEKVGGHTEDSGVFYFEQEGERYCITGDECFSIDCIKHNIPIENAYNRQNNIMFTEKCNKKNVNPLPSHDKSILSCYKKISPNIVRII